MQRIATDLLSDEGYVVESALNPLDGLKAISANPPDLLLLDIRLPDLDGFQTCKRIKSDPKIKHIPVIMVSVKSEESDVVVGLELGAEDYIIKPFRKRELLARVKTVLRRNDTEPEAPKLKIGPLDLDWNRHAAVLNRKPLTLTPKEFELLGYFMKNEGRVLTRASISEHVWGVEYTGSTRTIDVHVDQLRHKLGKHSDMIAGLKGIGYRFEANSN